MIALWLGHERVETTQVYLHADMQLKEQALNRTSSGILSILVGDELSVSSDDPVMI